MPFTDAVKLEAKRRAHFLCVVCHQPWVEVHHIVPQEHGGPDAIANAAPLCGSCHLRYGGNPDLRKQLREMRDFWWERCAADLTQPALSQLAEKVDLVHREVVAGSIQHRQALQEVKTLVLDHIGKAQATTTSASTITEAVSSVFAAGPVAVPTGPNTCPYCGLVNDPGVNWCVHCGALLF
jgi:hypothetical protein